VRVVEDVYYLSARVHVSRNYSQFRITIGDMGDVLLDGHIGQFRDDDLESQEPVVSQITRGMAYD